MSKTEILLTYPPMLGIVDRLKPRFDEAGWNVHCPEVVHTLSEDALIALLPKFEGWIIGDDPATRRVFEAGKAGQLRAVVKWGVGADNVDFDAARSLGVPIRNTPGMFGAEVADIAMSYVTALARETFVIDRGVRTGGWPKPRGISLRAKTIGVVGFGDIGRNVARRARAAELHVRVYDPFYPPESSFDAENGADPDLQGVTLATWPEGLDTCDFLVFCCTLTRNNRHMLNAETLALAKNGVRVVNVAQGPLIDTQALIEALRSGKVHSVALEVAEEEPVPSDSPLLTFERNIFGAHNASNTEEAVLATSERAIVLLSELLTAG